MSAGLTHPDCVSLVDHLFGCAGKMVAAIILTSRTPYGLALDFHPIVTIAQRYWAFILNSFSADNLFP